MKQKISQPEFGENEDKPFEGDLLKREQEIKDLTPMIHAISSPATMALDAEWGAGKTAFIKMWKAHLNNEASARAFYFNAWETDFAADPLMPFVETITAQLPQKKHQKLKDGVKALFPIIVGDLVRKVAGVSSAEFAKNAAENLFAPHSKMDEFKAALGEFVKSQGKRVVIFVDELDRCRPDYAIKVLERIKHLFGVPGVIFVLATNRAQLCHSVNALYGANFDADAYLRRFIEFDYAIKAPDTSDFVDARLKGLEIDKFLSGRGEDSEIDRRDLHETLTLLAKLHNSSLRDVEQLLMRVVFVLWSLRDDSRTIYRFYPILLAFLVVARLKMPAHYHKYIHPADNGKEMVTHWRNQLQEAGIDKAGPTASHITAYIISAKYSHRQNTPDAPDIPNLIESYADGVNNTAYRSVEQYLRDLHRHYRGQMVDLSYLAKKIEMLDGFHFPDNDNTEGNGN
ncbi:MAG: KAP family P-loop NTPase fold protein [Gammaproteobacteria bacterium]